MIPAGAHNLSFSGNGLLCAATQDSVQIYKDCCIKAVRYPYLTHKVNRSVTDIEFAPFEDVMGIGHAGGFTSILVPGSGDPNFDALEVNPYQTKSQRKEAEVKALLEKIQPDLICLDPERLGEVDTDALKESLDAKKAKLYIKPEKIDFEPRMKTKGKGGTAKRFHVKRTVIEEEKRVSKRDLIS
jgi:U3 small nucleolar RNA-associated protein 7